MAISIANILVELVFMKLARNPRFDWVWGHKYDHQTRDNEDISDLSRIYMYIFIMI